MENYRVMYSDNTIHKDFSKDVVFKWRVFYDFKKPVLKSFLNEQKHLCFHNEITKSCVTGGS